MLTTGRPAGISYKTQVRRRVEEKSLRRAGARDLEGHKKTGGRSGSWELEGQGCVMTDLAGVD